MSLTNRKIILGSAFVLVVFFCVFFLTLKPPQIKDEKLAEKVTACSASLGEKASLDLVDLFKEHFKDGKLSASFKVNALTVFTDMDSFKEEDRLKVYEDYLTCIEKLNVHE